MKKTTVFSLMLSACCFAGLSAQEANHFVVKANKLGAEIFLKTSIMVLMEVCMLS